MPSGKFNGIRNCWNQMTPFMLLVLIYWREKINTVKSKTQILLQVSKKFGLTVNKDRSKYVDMTQNQNQQQCRNMNSMF
jgi:hypothetical protein